MTYKPGLGLVNWIYTHNSELQAIQRYCWSTHFTVHRYTRTRVLSLHQSWQRIYNRLSLQVTHEVFSQRNSFLAIILQLPNQFNSSAPKLISKQAGISKLDSTRLLLLNLNFLYNHFARTTQKTQLIFGRASLQRRCITTEVARFLLAYSSQREYLPSRCLAMDVSDFPIPDFGHRATISYSSIA
jgi:hypothetical protein